MKTQIGVGAAVLAALAAEGKNFDRAELNAMLDKLAASPEPKVRRGPAAMCYSVMMPEEKTFEYICKKCGNRTVYPKNSKQMERVLARHRDEAARLRALGLDIVLDESALCGKCRSAKELNIPTRAKIVAEPTKREDQERFLWKIGESVEVIKFGQDYCYIHSLDPEWWVNAKYISENGTVLANALKVRCSPSLDGKEYDEYYKGSTLKRLPAKPGDPEDWVRVDLSDSSSRWHGRLVLKRCLGDFTYEEGSTAKLGRFDKLAWVINGKRLVIKEDDAKILEKFIKGDVYLYDGSDGTSVSMKSCLPRLRELLGEPKK